MQDLEGERDAVAIVLDRRRYEFVGDAAETGELNAVFHDRAVADAAGPKRGGDAGEKMPALAEVIPDVKAEPSVDACARLVGGAVGGGLRRAHAVVVVVEPGVAGGEHEIRGKLQPAASALGAGSEPPFGSARIARDIAQDLAENVPPIETLFVAQPEIGFGNAGRHSREARRHPFDRKTFETMRKERSRTLVGPKIGLE